MKFANHCNDFCRAWNKRSRKIFPKTRRAGNNLLRVCKKTFPHSLIYILKFTTIATISFFISKTCSPASRVHGSTVRSICASWMKPAKRIRFGFNRIKCLAASVTLTFLQMTSKVSNQKSHTLRNSASPIYTSCRSSKRLKTRMTAAMPSAAIAMFTLRLAQ